MRHLKLVNRTWPTFDGIMGLIFVVLFLVAGPVNGDDSPVASSGTFTKESKGKADGQSTFSPGRAHKEKEDSPVIGGGIRTPPDIGASGTASPTPPVRTESPTDEPHILPGVSPVLPHPSDTESVPATKGQPIGQPDHLKKKGSGDSLQ